MTTTTIHRLGDTGVLVDLPDLEAVLRLDALVAAAREDAHPALADVVDVVPAARTLLVTVPTGGDLGALTAALAPLAAAAVDDPDPDRGTGVAREVVVPVVYDGPDLHAVAEHTGLTPAEVVAAHTGTPWRAAFGGFAPGFAYLVGGDPRLEVPRRTDPRTAVPDGAVALAGTFSAVYPRTSPGGWQLVGRLAADAAPMWDVTRTPPALLGPGDVVRFVDAEAAS